MSINRFLTLALMVPFGLNLVQRIDAGRQRLGEHFDPAVGHDRGARVALCATEGASDLLVLRRQDRASLYDLAVSEGVNIRWWSPWNEPNGPFFISPQRSRCSSRIDSNSWCSTPS